MGLELQIKRETTNALVFGRVSRPFVRRPI